MDGNPKNQNPAKNDSKMITQEIKESTGKIMISLSFRSTPKLVFISCQLRPILPMKPYNHWDVNKIIILMIQKNTSQQEDIDSTTEQDIFP
jgi:hypothetical protein